VDSKEAKQVMAETRKALQAVAEAHGLEIGKVGASFGVGEIKLRVAMAEPGESAEARAVREIGHLYGLDASDLGRKFSWGQNDFEFVGLRPSAPKWPILAKKVEDGRLYKLPLNTAPAISRAAGRKLTPEQTKAIILG
jgi:hypothetical protein